MDTVKDKKKKLVNRKERNKLKASNTKVKVNADPVKTNDSSPSSKDIYQLPPPYLHKRQEYEQNNKVNNDEDILSDYEKMLDYLDVCSDIESDEIDNFDVSDENGDGLDSDQPGVLSWSSSVSSDTSSYTLQTMNNLLLANEICNNPNDNEDDISTDDDDDDDAHCDLREVEDLLSDDNSNNISLESLENDIDLEINENLSSLSDFFEDADDNDENSSSDLG